MNSKFTIYLELVPSIERSIIEELCQISHELIIPLSPYEDTIFQIKKILKTDIKNEDLLNNLSSKNISGITHPESFLNKDLLKITCITNIPSEIPQVVKESWSSNDSIIYSSMDPIEFNKSYIYDIVKKRMHDLIFSVNLAQMGALSINKYIIFQDDNPNIMGGKSIDYSVFKKALVNNARWNYPSIKTLTIKETWDWLIGFHDFLLGFSETPTTRALINLNEISKSDSIMKLFRSVMGLEALYTSGTGNLQQQVKDKSQLVLGNQQEFKKLYKNMYDFRSKYIHGELNFASSTHLDISKVSEVYYQDLEKCTHFALLILFASIQELIIRSWQGYNFSQTYLVENL